MKSYEVILFDLDGTITDSSEGITNSVKYMLKQYGIEEKGKKVLVATSKPEVYARRIMDYFHLTQYFDYVAAAAGSKADICY